MQDICWTTLLKLAHIFSTCWNFILKFKLSALENDLGHWSQGNILSPEWVLLCILKGPLWKNNLRHQSQGKSFS